jgi:hypothetical protein
LFGNYFLSEIETYSQKGQNNITQCINFKGKMGKIVKSLHKPHMSFLVGFSTPKQGEGFPSFIPSLPFLPLPSLTFPFLPLKTPKQSLKISDLNLLIEKIDVEIILSFKWIPPT